MASPAKIITDSEDEITVLSSVGVQGTYYNLVGITPKIEDLSDRPSTSKRSPVKVQRARKTFPTAQGAFKIPAAEAETTAAAALLDAKEKQTVLDQMKRSYAKTTFSESDTSSESSTRKAPRELPALIHIGGEADSPVKKQRLDSTLSEQSTILQEPIGSPPTPASTPAPPANREDPVFAEMAALMGENLEEDLVSSTVRPVDSSPSIQEISSGESDREAARKSDEDYLPSALELKSSPMATPSGSAAGSSNKRSRASHELERLYMDEGAARILSEMAKRGTNRRSTANTSPVAPPAAAVLPKPKPSPKRPPKPKLATDEQQQPKKTKPKKKTSSPMTNGVDKEPKGPLNQWKAVQTSKPDGSTVYVPRKIMNPADASRIVQRRSYTSSDSSTEDEATPRRVMVKKAGTAAASSTSPMVPSPRLALSSPDGSGSSLLDHGYTRGTHEPRDEAAASMSSYSSAEINIRSLDRHLLHVTLSPSSTNATSPPNSLSANVLKELTVLLRQLKAEKDVHVVLITSGGPEFCTGIDISTLMNDSIPARKESARNISNIVQDFIVELANCDKILVGGVNGAAVGLGVTMLRYFDVVYASDKSTFFLPYAKLAQGPEGGASLALQNSSTPNNLFGLMLYEGRRLTAEEAKTAGLVNDVLWRSDFREVLMPRVQAIATQSSQAMLATKKNCRLAFRLKLPAILKQESKLLRETWPSEEFQRRAAAVLSGGQLLPS